MDARGLRSWSIALLPGETHPVVGADWADTLVVVERGELELECCSGRRATFVSGSVLTLAGLSVRCLHNHGPSVVVLCAVTRDRTPHDDAPMTD